MPSKLRAVDPAITNFYHTVDGRLQAKGRSWSSDLEPAAPFALPPFLGACDLADAAQQALLEYVETNASGDMAFLRRRVLVHVSTARRRRRRLVNLGDAQIVGTTSSMESQIIARDWLGKALSLSGFSGDALIERFLLGHSFSELAGRYAVSGDALRKRVGRLRRRLLQLG